MDFLAGLLAPLLDQQSSGFYIIASLLIMLVVVFFMHRTYRASLKVEARLAEFSSLTNSVFGAKLRLIETSADAYDINRKVLGPLARIIDQYCVFTTDLHGVLTYANDKLVDLSGTPLTELVGRHQKEVGVRAIHAEAASDMRRTLQQERVWHGQLCLRTRDSGIRWVDTFVFPLSFITEADTGYIYFGTDVTRFHQQNDALRREVRSKEASLHRAENMLLHSEKMASLGVISAGIAHEINNPIAYVSANINRLGEYLETLSAFAIRASAKLPPDQVGDLFPPADAPHNRDDITYAVEDYPALMQETRDGILRIRKIISDLKSFSHEGTDAFTPVDVHKCIETALNLARHELRRQIKLDVTLSAATAQISGSESQLTQVLLNLVVNAAQAMQAQQSQPVPGVIQIRTRNHGTHLIIEVIDNGPGIQPEHMATLFEPFFTTKPVGEGTGLGLAISQDIVQRHQGEISVHSTPGDGAHFSIRLPLLNAASARPELATPAPPSRPGQKAHRPHGL